MTLNQWKPSVLTARLRMPKSNGSSAYWLADVCSNTKMKSNGCKVTWTSITKWWICLSSLLATRACHLLTLLPKSWLAAVTLHEAAVERFGEGWLTGTVVRTKLARCLIRVDDVFGDSRVFVENYHDCRAGEPPAGTSSAGHAQGKGGDPA